MPGVHCATSPKRICDPARSCRARLPEFLPLDGDTGQSFQPETMHDFHHSGKPRYGALGGIRFAPFLLGTTPTTIRPGFPSPASPGCIPYALLNNAYDSRDRGRQVMQWWCGDAGQVNAMSR